jgi:NAD(P)-dependent dehydrogenase (short-subunit alcohol dehydrogenase family)
LETLNKKIALVTGGASGIGLATSRLLAAGGATVAVVDIDADAAEKAAREVGGIAIPADVSRSEEWPRIVSKIRSEFGGLDAAHLNAGVTTGVADITELTDEQYRRIVGVNQDGVVFGVRAVLPEMRARGGGAIVATASLAGIIAFPLDAAYTLTKHAVVGLVRALGRVVGAEGITLNAVCPGLVDTPLLSQEIRDALEASGFPMIDAKSVAEAVVGCMLGDATGQAIVVQAGLEPTPYRFGRPPGPREPGAVGKLPPEWIADPGTPKPS